MTAEVVRWPIRMNPTDALFWSMDRIPEMRSTIGALVLLERAPSWERIRQEFERVSYGIPRMRQRVTEVPLGLAPPEWVDDPQFDLDYHLRHVAVPAPGGMEEVLAEMGPLYATAFDRDRPLWEGYVIDGLAGNRGALFIKMHHCLLDGVGGSRLFEALLQERQDATASARLTRWVDTRSTSTPALLARAALYNVGEALTATRTVLGTLGAAALAPNEALDWVQQGVKMMRGFSYELTATRGDSPLHQRRSLSRQLAIFDISMAQIDAVRTHVNATNNDVVLTIVSGAMRRWHHARGTEVKELRAMMPINIRSNDDMHAGNRLGLLAVALPIGEANPLRRLRLIQQRTGEVKADRRARLYPLMARVMSALPTAVAEQIGRQQTTSRTNFVCTNVPGPRRTCYFAGETIEKVYPYAPLVGDHPVAIALYSYRGMLYVGLDVDPLAMPDLPVFREALQAACEEVWQLGGDEPVVAPPRPRRRRRRRRVAA